MINIHKIVLSELITLFLPITFNVVNSSKPALLGLPVTSNAKIVELLIVLKVTNCNHRYVLSHIYDVTLTIGGRSDETKRF